MLDKQAARNMFARKVTTNDETPLIRFEVTMALSKEDENVAITTDELVQTHVDDSAPVNCQSKLHEKEEKYEGIAMAPRSVLLSNCINNEFPSFDRVHESSAGAGGGARVLRTEKDSVKGV